MKTVDIHLVSWNRPEITELTIRTIARNSERTHYRLTVVDNGSSPEQQQMLLDLGEAGLIDNLILWEENRGLEAARDHMLRHYARGTYFICADNDCLPMPRRSDRIDWIERLVALMDMHPNYGAISCRTQVMIGSGNIFDGLEDEPLVDFPHPGGSLRIMNTKATLDAGGWEGKPGRGSEERWICGELQKMGWSTAFAVQIPTLHLFGQKDTDRWGYPADWTPEDTGHSDIYHPALEQGDDPVEVEKYAGKELADAYFNN